MQITDFAYLTVNHAFIFRLYYQFLRKIIYIQIHSHIDTSIVYTSQVMLTVVVYFCPMRINLSDFDSFTRLCIVKHLKNETTWSNLMCLTDFLIFIWSRFVINLETQRKLFILTSLGTNLQIYFWLQYFVGKEIEKNVYNWIEFIILDWINNSHIIFAYGLCLRCGYSAFVW